MALNRTQITNIVFNETRSLSGVHILEARINIAHAIMNADSSLGRRPISAPTHASVPSAEQIIYTHCRVAVERMFSQRENSEDPTGGATNFNFRKNDSRAAFYGIPIKTQVGPFSNSYPTDDLPSSGIYANTYGR